MRAPPPSRYSEPFHWWGPGWTAPRLLGVQDLLGNGTLDIESAALLWSLAARRQSLIVVGGPGGLGKTTLLTALCQLLPPGTTRLYTRGCYETFAFLDDPMVDPRESVLLINEISPHLPVYLWGPAVARTLEAAQRGFGLYATAHGESVVEFVASLTGSPLRIPAGTIAAFAYVVLVQPTRSVASGRRVREIWRLRPTSGGLDMAPVIVLPEPGDAAGAVHVSLRDGWFSPSELTWRAAELARSWEHGVPQLPLELGLESANERQDGEATEGHRP